MYKCIINNKEYKTLSSMSRCLRLIGWTLKEYHDTYLKIDGEGICKNCKKETPFIKGVYRKFCNVKCSGTYQGFLNGTMERSEEYRHKLSKGNKDRSPEWIAKREKTIEEKYGCTYTEFKRMQFQKRLDKMTKHEKDAFYENAVLSQDKGKKSYKYKKYILNNIEVNVQGYEPFILDILKKHFCESEISVGRSKETMVRYIDSEGKNRRYFADIFFGKDILIEVKSPWVLKKHGLSTRLKMEAAKKSGKVPILIVIENTKQMEMLEKELVETISSQVWCDPERFNDYPFIGVGYKQMITEVLGNHYNNGL